MTEKKKPKYSAYQPVEAADGIQMWTQHTFNHQAPWTDDDARKFDEVCSSIGGPYERIEKMQDMLVTLPTDNPFINVHADAIRAIHAEVQAPPIGFTRERLARLNEASALWDKIMVIRDVMPLATQGARQSQSQSDRAKGSRKLTSVQADRIRRQYAEAVASGEKYGAIKRFARIYEVSESTVKAVIKNKKRI